VKGFRTVVTVVERGSSVVFYIMSESIGSMDRSMAVIFALLLVISLPGMVIGAAGSGGKDGYDSTTSAQIESTENAS
jgi:hypothetical protein